MPYELNLSSGIGWQINGKQAVLPGQSIPMWNAAFFNRLLAKKTLELRLSVFDILNQNKSFQQTMGENFIETSQGLMLQRFFFLSAVWQFSKFGGRRPPKGRTYGEGRAAWEGSK